MENLNDSLEEAVCIEEEVFFGPIADKETKMREHFDNVLINENKTVESHLAVENDISKNDSLYKSFSVDESKYDSFDDSLNEEIDKKTQETKHITIRKTFDKLKSNRQGFYDSLEDVCSLVSNFDKCSISCEVESNSNFNNKQHAIEDSLKNPPVAVANKSNGGSEQVHFDDDSLAIFEFENTFDDSLEEINDICVLSSIEIEEIDDIENITAENQNIAIKVEQNPVCVSRNLFDTSVQIVYEKKWLSDTADPEESSGDKNMLYDSLSNSDFKDILKDSLEESEKCSENLNFLRQVSRTTDVDAPKSERMFADQNALDASVQIVYENSQNACHIEKKSEMNNPGCNEFSKDRLENCKYVNKDFVQMHTKTANEYDLHSSSMNAVLSTENTITSPKISENLSTDVSNNVLYSGASCAIFRCIDTDAQKSERMFVDQNILDASVQIVYEKFHNACYIGNNSEMNNSGYNEFSNDSLENCKNVNKDSIVKMNYSKTANEHDSHSSNMNVIALSIENTTASPKNSENLSIDTSNNVLYSDSNANQDYKIMKDNSKISMNPSTDASDNSLYSDSNANQDYKIMKNSSDNPESVIPVSAIDNSNYKETFTVDTCHLKLLSDNINIDEDLKLKLHIEVTDGNKTCQMASQDIKVLSTESGDSKKCDTDSLTPIPIEHPSEDNASEERDVLDNRHSKLTEDYNVVRENIVCDETILNKNLCEKSTTNITRRAKLSGSQLTSDLEDKGIFPENLSNISLLQALDLYDISESFLNESVIQSNDSLIPLNLCCKDQDFFASIFRDECKENVPQPLLTKKKGFCTSSKRMSPNKECISKSPKQIWKSPSFKDSTKRTPGTKIPVRKIDNFAIPVATSNKLAKQVSMPLSAEKVKKCQHSPHSAGKKTPVTTPNKTPHFCKVRNTIFSKVPQIVPSKKYMNIQSPVAQYIKNIHGSGKTPRFDAVLRDCMNQPLESPYSHQTPKGGVKSGTLKFTKKKA